MSGHTQGISSVYDLHDGRIVSGSYADETLRVWNLSTWQCEHVLVGEDCLRRSMDGDIYLNSLQSVFAVRNSRAISVCAYFDVTLCIWNLSTGQREHVLHGHGGWITSVTVLSDTRVVSGSQDQTVRVWNMVTGVCEHVLHGHTDRITAVCVLKNDDDDGDGDGDETSRIVTGSRDKTLRIWNTNTGQCEHILQGHTEGVTAVHLLQENDADDDDNASTSWGVISTSSDKTLRVWNALTGQCSRVCKLDGSFISCIHGGEILVGSSTGRIFKIHT